MTDITLHFEKAGLFTSIQDGGRIGVQNMGIPIGGAMDQEAMRDANYLVGNAPNDPVIEMTLQGAVILIEGSGQIALTGGYFKGKLNNHSLPFYQTLDVQDGDKITIEGAIYGSRTYLAVRGEIEAEKWLGSYSAATQYLDSFGLESHFENGRQVSYHSHDPFESRKIKRAKHPMHAECAIIRTLPGPDFESFDMEVVHEFYDTIFTVSGECNRMGYRLNERLKNYHNGKEEISSGIIPGTIQVTHHGGPIILMADAQTTGGYPRIANVVSEDIDLLAQMHQGHELRFMLVSLKDL